MTTQAMRLTQQTRLTPGLSRHQTRITASRSIPLQKNQHLSLTPQCSLAYPTQSLTGIHGKPNQNVRSHPQSPTPAANARMASASGTKYPCTPSTRTNCEIILRLIRYAMRNQRITRGSCGNLSISILWKNRMRCLCSNTDPKVCSPLSIFLSSSGMLYRFG